MRWQPLSVCKTLLIIKVQLSISYNSLKLSGYPEGRDLLDLSKKLWCSVGERFFRNAAKEMEKKSHLGENHQENGVARDPDRTHPRRKMIAEYAKDRKSDKKSSTHVVCWNEMALVNCLVTYMYSKHHTDHFVFRCFSLLMILSFLLNSSINYCY